MRCPASCEEPVKILSVTSSPFGEKIGHFDRYEQVDLFAVDGAFTGHE
jgi:hypothetical protein